jgi:hypothetical protein
MGANAVAVYKKEINCQMMIYEPFIFKTGFSKIWQESADHLLVLVFR